MNTIVIKITSYPCNMSFEVHEKLPIFKYGCKIRTNLLRNELKKNKHKMIHEAQDFIVEKIRKTKNGEYWCIGS